MDSDRIARNIQKMQAQGATEADIAAYVDSEKAKASKPEAGGWTEEKLRNTIKMMEASGFTDDEVRKRIDILGGEGTSSRLMSPPGVTDEFIRESIELNFPEDTAEKRAAIRTLEKGRSIVPMGKEAESGIENLGGSIMSGALRGYADEAVGWGRTKIRGGDQKVNTDIIRNSMDEFAHNYPWLDIGGKIVGDVGSLALTRGVGQKVAPGATKTVDNLLMKGPMYRRAAVGGGIGSADAFAYGTGEGEGGFENRLESGVYNLPFGAVGGAAAPVLGKVAGKYVGKPLARMLAKKEGKVTSSGAAKTLAKMLSRGDIDDALSGSADVPIFAKTSGGMYGARATHGVSPEGSRTITKAAEAYREGTGERAMKAIAGALGKRKSIRQELRGFIKSRRDKAGPLYKKAREVARPVNISKAIELIDKRLTPGVREITGNSLPNMPMEGKLAYIKKMLHNKAGSQAIEYDRVKDMASEIYDQFISSGSRHDRKVFGEIRAALVDALDTATTDMTGKSWHKVARKAFAGDMEVQDAFMLGKDLLKKGQSGVDVEDLLDDIGKMSATERDALAKGMGTAIGLRADDATPGALTRMFKRRDSGASRKLRAVFGDAKGEKLREALALEEKSYDYAGRAIYGSDTAQTRAAQELLDVKQPKGGGGVTSTTLGAGVSSATGDPTYFLGATGINTAKKILGSGRSARDQKRIAEIAKILSATGDEQTKYLDDMLAARSRLGKAGKKAERRSQAVIRALLGAPVANEARQQLLPR